MSSTDYFTCTVFSILMPVAECESRRKAAAVTKKKLQGTAQTYDESIGGSAFMKKRCGNCTLYRDLLAPENRITHEQMMERLGANPSQAASEDRKVGHVDLDKSMRPYHFHRGN
jgi:hypothetical protein